MNLTKINASLFMATVMCMFSLGLEVAHETDSSHNDRVMQVHDQEPDEISHKTVTGQLSGFDCAVVGVLCPTTHRGADYTTGVFTEDEEFYFVVNIPQSFLQQYFRETVEIEGNVYNPYDHAVEPETIHLVDGSERTLVYEAGYFIDENNRRATFQGGAFRDGRWIVQ